VSQITKCGEQQGKFCVAWKNLGFGCSWQLTPAQLWSGAVHEKSQIEAINSFWLLLTNTSKSRWKCSHSGWHGTSISKKLCILLLTR
jgi:hypothetical protein